MIEREQNGQPSDWRPDTELQTLLDAQRRSLMTTFGHNQPVPQVGDIWLSGTNWPLGPEEGLSAMLVVLRAFSEVWSSQPLFDVAPLSEDERLASEWSLILSASDSGIGLPLVLHIDVQCTTTSSMLTRRVGALSGPARADLNNVMRAYAMGDSSSIEWHVGRAGSISIRLHHEWEEFARQLVNLSKAFAAPLTLERTRQEVDEPDETAELSDHRLLAVASGVKQKEIDEWEPYQWEYRNVAPFVYCIGFPCKSPPSRLGEAIAHYYSQVSSVVEVYRAAPPRLDSEAFQRLAPLLDASLTRLFEATDLRTALRELVGAAATSALDQAETDYAIIVESVRWAKKVSRLTAGAHPMRLAARRTTE